VVIREVLLICCMSTQQLEDGQQLGSGVRGRHVAEELCTAQLLAGQGLKREGRESSSSIKREGRGGSDTAILRCFLVDATLHGFVFGVLVELVCLSEKCFSAKYVY
jgi:hypothetical protein